MTVPLLSTAPVISTVVGAATALTSVCVIACATLPFRSCLALEPPLAFVISRVAISAQTPDKPPRAKDWS